MSLHSSAKSTLEGIKKKQRFWTHASRKVALKTLNQKLSQDNVTDQEIITAFESAISYIKTKGKFGIRGQKGSSFLKLSNEFLSKHQVELKEESKRNSEVIDTQIAVDKTIQIKRAQFQEIVQAVQWGVKESWDPCLGEAETFDAAKCDCRITKLNGVPVGSLISVQYPNKIASIGNYITVPAYRGQGYGKKLWDNMMGSLSDSESVFLYSVTDQVKNYEKSGFRVVYTVTRYKDVVERAAMKEHKTEPSLEKITIKRNVAADDILKYHQSISSTISLPILTQRMRYGSTFTAVNNESQIVGYGIRTLCEEGGYRIAGFYANSVSVASDLYLNMVKDLPEKATVTLDIPQVSPLATQLPFFSKPTKLFDTVYMVKGKDIQQDIRKVVAVPALAM